MNFSCSSEESWEIRWVFSAAEEAVGSFFLWRKPHRRHICVQCLFLAAAAGNLTLCRRRHRHPGPSPAQPVDYSINLIMRCQSFRCLGPGFRPRPRLRPLAGPLWHPHPHPVLSRPGRKSDLFSCCHLIFVVLRFAPTSVAAEPRPSAFLTPLESASFAYPFGAHLKTWRDKRKLQGEKLKIIYGKLYRDHPET